MSLLVARLRSRWPTEQALRAFADDLALALGVLGLMVGSFLNVVVHRLPLMLEARWRAEAPNCSARTPPPMTSPA